MQKLIAGHNARVLKLSNPGGSSQDGSQGCQCDGGPALCNLGGDCQTENLVYKADIEVGGVKESYIGQTTKTFKQRVGVHNSNIRTNRKATALATYVVDLKYKGVVNNDVIDKIEWSKIKAIDPRKKGDRLCGLCNTEKTLIAVGDQSVFLNKRKEIMTRCRHRDTLVLTNNLNKHNTQRRVIAMGATTTPVST